jgi:hypothetical protein
MKCDEIRELLSAYADDELSTEQRKLVEQHLGECADCRNRLIEYRQVSQRIGILQTAPSISGFTQSVMSRIREPHPKRYAWSVKRSLYVAVPLVIVLAVVGSLFATRPFLTPEKVMAKATSALNTIQSYLRTEDSFSSYVFDPNAKSYVYTHHTEMGFAGDRSFCTTTDLTTNHYHKQIVIGDLTYSYGTASLAPTIEEIQAFTPSSLLTQAQLDLLVAIKKLPDDTIDGVLCYHYQGIADVEKFVQGQKIYLEKLANALNLDDASAEKMVNQRLNYWRTKKITRDFWIGKDDFLIRQWKEVCESTESSPDYWGSVSLIQFHDYNVPVIIEAPLNESGGLLPGWFTQP